MTGFQLLGIGTAVPEHFIQQSEAADFATTCLAGQADGEKAASLVRALYRRSGVQTRHSVVLDSSSDASPATQTFYEPSEMDLDRGPGTAARMHCYESRAPELATAAAKKAIAQAGIDVSLVTHLVTVSCSGFSAPGVDLELIKRLGLSSTVARSHIGFMGCHGALNGLRVAKAFTDADPKAVVLVCAVELCTLHHQYGWVPEEIVANSLFADGAAALVGCRGEASPSPDDRPPLPALIDNFCSVIPETEHMMSWRIGDAGFRMTLSPEVPGVITASLPALLNGFLQRHGLRRDEIEGWAIHPGGPRILKACCDVAGLNADQIQTSTSVLAEFGNMSSPTVLFILDRLLQQGTNGPIVMMGFGPGLNVEIALLNSAIH